MRTLKLSICYMTRIKLKLSGEYADGDFAKATLWFPLTSLIVGIASAAALYALSFTQIPLLAALGGVIVCVLITGGLHIDGLADTADGFFARGDREKTLQIMHDSANGTFGTLAIVFDVLLKTILLSAIITKYGVIPAVAAAVATPIVGKISLMNTMFGSKYPGESGMGKAMVENLKTWQLMIIQLICGAVIVALYQVFTFAGVWFAVPMLIATIFVGFLLKIWSRKKIGGTTGDVLGASNELGEIIALLILAF